MKTLKQSGGGGGSSFQSASWILWVVLGLVVVGLLAVISRLLPKPAASR